MWSYVCVVIGDIIQLLVIDLWSTEIGVLYDPCKKHHRDSRLKVLRAACIYQIYREPVASLASSELWTRDFWGRLKGSVNLSSPLWLYSCSEYFWYISALMLLLTQCECNISIQTNKLKRFDSKWTQYGAYVHQTNLRLMGSIEENTVSWHFRRIILFTRFNLKYEKYVYI